MRCLRLLVVGLVVAGAMVSWKAGAHEQPAEEANLPLPTANLPLPTANLPLPTQWDTLYVALLKKGTPAADRPAEPLQAVINRHILYQLQLQQSGRAVAAGGFGRADDGLIGMTLLRAKSLDDAKRLADADPAVATDHFSATVREWYVPAGRLPATEKPQ